MNTSAKPIDPAIIVAGGVELTVIDRTGKAVNVKVRLLEMEHYLDFVAKLQAEPQLAELLCGQPAGWAAALSTASVLDIVEKGMELNFTSARRFMERRAGLADALRPLEGAARRILEATQSATSAPASA